MFRLFYANGCIKFNVMSSNWMEKNTVRQLSHYIKFQNEMSVILDWAKSKGLPLGGEAGYWTGK